MAADFADAVLTARSLYYETSSARDMPTKMSNMIIKTPLLAASLT
jgi:hypothetical protein